MGEYRGSVVVVVVVVGRLAGNERGAFFGEGPGVDARAPVGERGDWAERHRRLRAGAEEAPEEQRDEQRGASGPHGGAPIE